MIRVTTLNGRKFALNPDLIVNIDETPDTTIALVTGQTFRVRESLAEVCSKVIEFRRDINSPSQGVRLCVREKTVSHDYGETEQ